MSHKLKITLGIILGLFVLAGSLAWKHASRPLFGADAPQMLACRSSARAVGRCGAPTPTVIHLGTIVVTPPPSEERYAFSFASPQNARGALPQAKQANVSG